MELFIMNTDKVKLSEDLTVFINRLSFLGESLEEKVNVSLAISLFAGKQVSLAKAAELANKSLTDFMDILKKINIPWCDYTEDMKNSDDLAIGQMFHETEN
jgi:predicted HTH domain antitoxin